MSTDVSLSTDETKQLKKLEGIIEHGLAQFIEVGRALLQIRDSRLYRLEYRSFEAYCRDRWALSRSRAYQLVDGATVVDKLSTVVDADKLPENEFTVRPLTKLPPKIQAKVWIELVKEAPESVQITASDVKARVKTYLRKHRSKDEIEAERGWRERLHTEWPRVYNAALAIAPEAERLEAEAWIWDWIDQRRWKIAGQKKAA